jgi:hypothetical protein
MRPASGAEPGGRRGARHMPATDQCVFRMRAGRPRSQGRIGAGGASPQRVANPGAGDAPGLGRGARRATGSQAYASHRPTRLPDAGGTPALPGENRRSNASPGGGRDARAPRGKSALAGCVSTAFRQSRSWRCARPRARSPEGDGEPGIRQPPTNASPGCGRDARAPRGKPALQCVFRMRAGRPRSQGRIGAGGPRLHSISPIPELEMRPASGAEPGGRRGAMCAWCNRLPQECRSGDRRSQGGMHASESVTP